MGNVETLNQIRMINTSNTNINNRNQFKIKSSYKGFQTFKRILYLVVDAQGKFPHIRKRQCFVNYSCFDRPLFVQGLLQVIMNKSY